MCALMLNNVSGNGGCESTHGVTSGHTGAHLQCMQPYGCHAMPRKTHSQTVGCMQEGAPLAPRKASSCILVMQKMKGGLLINRSTPKSHHYAPQHGGLHHPALLHVARANPHSCLAVASLDHTVTLVMVTTQICRHLLLLLVLLVAL